MCICFYICLRELGPLWVYSCFHFEGLNGILKTLIHRTQQADKQIFKSFSYLKQLPAVADEYNNSPYSFTCASADASIIFMECFKHIYYQQKFCLNNRAKVSDELFLLGRPIKDMLTENEKQYLCFHGIEDLSCVERYLRIPLKDIHYYSLKWYSSGPKTTNNSTIVYNDNNNLKLGIIQSFLVCKFLFSPLVFCVLSPLIRNDHVFSMYNTPIPHNISCYPPTPDSETVPTPVEHICSVCIYLSFSDVDNTMYVTISANLLEKH